MNAATNRFAGALNSVCGVSTCWSTPVSDHGDSLPQGHRLDLVVRDVHRRHSEPLVQPRERRAHRDPQLGVEIREGLVHEEGNRLAHERAADRDALTLTAREGGRLAVEELAEPERLRSVRNPPRPLLLRDLPPLQPELEVLVDGHMRVQRVVLEHHRDVAVLRRSVADIDAPDHDRAARQLLQAGHQPQERRLPAAGGADEHHELPLADLEADVVDRLDLAREDLRDVVQADARRPPAASLRDGSQTSSSGNRDRPVERLRRTLPCGPLGHGHRARLDDVVGRPADEHLDRARLDDVRVLPVVEAELRDGDTERDRPRLTRIERQTERSS